MADNQRRRLLLKMRKSRQRHLRPVRTLHINVVQRRRIPLKLRSNLQHHVVLILLRKDRRHLPLRKCVIQRVVDDLVIKQIDLPSKGADKVAYVVQIAPATSRAPHQANDYRYYKRLNFESTPMEDYEVRDLMRRSLEFGKKYGAGKRECFRSQAPIL